MHCLPKPHVREIAIEPRMPSHQERKRTQLLRGFTKCRTVLKLHNIHLAVSHHSLSALAIHRVHLSDQWSRELCLQFVFLPEDFCGALNQREAPGSRCFSIAFLTNFTSSERRGTVRCRSSSARKPRPLFRGGMFQSWDARRLVQRSSSYPRSPLVFLQPNLGWRALR